MADIDDEKAAQQVHPAKPDRDEPAPPDDPNERSAGRPQHEPKDPDAGEA